MGSDMGYSLCYTSFGWFKRRVESKSDHCNHSIKLTCGSSQADANFSILGIRERCDFFFVVGNSSTQIAGLSRHRPLQGSRQPVLISKGGVKEKSLLYLRTHCALHTLASPSDTVLATSHLSSPHHLQQSVMHVHKCSLGFVRKVCAQQQRSLPANLKLRVSGL